MSNYWEGILKQRIGRRRAMIGTGAGLSAAALLAACGGGSNEPEEQASGFVAKPVDTTKQAKKGGVFKGNIDSEPQTWDPMFADRSSATRNSRMQSRFIELKPGILGPATGEIIGDLADSWEISGDKLQITFKLVANAHFDPREPTNGRVVDAQDFIWSWDRFVKTGTLRGDYANSINPGAAIVSMTAVDARTVVLKLSEPQAGVLTQLTASNGGTYLVMPREAEDKYDPRRDVRSAGPYMLWEHKPSIGSTYKKNPGFHRDYGYFDTLELPIVTENATALAQFRAGQIYLRSSFPSQDIIPTKRDLPELLLQTTNPASNSIRQMFGYQEGPQSPFRDVRLRQAYSLAQDRDLFIEAVYNVSGLESEGIPVTTRWSTAVPASDDVWWLDPKGKDFGPNADFYKFNQAEARKLVSAAGFPNGLDIIAHYITTSQYGLDFQKHIEIILNMASEVGFRWTNDPPGYTQNWRSGFADVKGRHDGVAFRIDTGPPDSGDRLHSHYNSTGTLFQGFAAEGRPTFSGDPTMDDLTNKIRREFDLKKRIEYGYELQKLEAKQQYWPFAPGGASGVRLAWPALGNFGTYEGGRDNTCYMWLDETKAPIKKA